MSEKELNDKLIAKIKLLTETVWGERVKVFNINKWLNNFSEIDERINMLYLLSQFMYFGDRQVKSLLRSLYRDLFQYPIIKRFRESNADTINTEIINRHFEDELRKTRFIGIGEPSESGQHLLYPFRQENNLRKDLFINASEILSESEIHNERGDLIGVKERLTFPEISNYVFIDDFCGSGSQAKRYSKEIVQKMKSFNPTCRVIYLMLFGTTKGKEFIKNQTLFDSVDSVFDLDDSFKCFHDSSRYFMDMPAHVDKEKAKKISQFYGEQLMKDICQLEGVREESLDDCAKANAHGFKNGQLLLGFSHNTPDNTLPIFWYSEKKIDWYPIFKRYNKKY